MKNLHEDQIISNAIKKERKRQENDLELIASENYASPAVIEATGSVFTNKYAEGKPEERFYGGCENADVVEQEAERRAKKLFGAEWVNVQPHSGAQANAAVFLTLLNAGDTFLGLDLSCGGHLTHGSPVNFSGKLYNAEHYGVDPKTGRIDLNEVEDRAKEVDPKLISIGASAYTRDFNYKGFREIADQVGAFLWMDMAHTAGLIATGILNDPLPYVDVVTTTTHKTLRGARGGMILVGDNYELDDKKLGDHLDSGVFPGTQGGPLVHVIAAKAVGFKEALMPSFVDYSQQIVKNTKSLCDSLRDRGYNLVTGGSDNHCVLIDLRETGITGQEAENALSVCNITTNKNMVPDDNRSPFVTSGLRIGTPAMTTRGLKESHFGLVGDLIADVLDDIENESLKEKTEKKVKEICDKFPVYE